MAKARSSRRSASRSEASRSTRPSTTPAFDGDWAALIERLDLTGMAGMVARHGELVAHRNGYFEVVVPESHRMYAEKAYQEKLQAALADHFGSNIRVNVRVGPTAG